ncbi:MAG: WYL domain-containing protein [Planctomycetaceae bacterium]|nr:MAG: WYL domain-containing protein [Planctomycetaceae bacterium]
MIVRSAVHNGGWTVSELADELEVSQKTIRRDLVTFTTVGFPVEETIGIYGRKSYRQDPAWGNPNVAFTFDEALALYLGRKFLQPLHGTFVGEAAERALAKIRSSLGSQILRYPDHVGDAFYETSFGVTDYSAHAEILDRLLVGIEDRRVVRITYQSQRATEPVTYDVHPSQQIIDHRDGSLTIEFQVFGTVELTSWILSFGQDAEVLEPADLRQAIIDELDTLRKKYQPTKSPVAL